MVEHGNGDGAGEPDGNERHADSGTREGIVFTAEQQEQLRKFAAGLNEKNYPRMASYRERAKRFLRDDQA